MYFEIYEQDNKRFIKIELNKNDINYLLKEKTLAEFDSDNNIRIEIIDETKDYPLDGNHN